MLKTVGSMITFHSAASLLE